MSDSRAASRYIKSLLGLAVEKGVLEQINQDMQLFAKVCAENRTFTLMLRNPIINHDKKSEILHKLFEGKVNALTLAIFDILTRKNREPLLPSIAAEFHAAYNIYKGVGKAVVTTAVPLDAKLRGELEQTAKKLSKKDQVELTETIDPDLIGGFILNVGDKQIDASIKSKLKVLKLNFSQNFYEKRILI